MKKRIFSLILAFTMVASTFFGVAPSVQASDDTSAPIVLESNKDVKPVKDVSMSAPVNVKRILTSTTNKASMSSYNIPSGYYILAPLTSEYSGNMTFDIKTSGSGQARIRFVRSYEIVDGSLYYNYDDDSSLENSIVNKVFKGGKTYNDMGYYPVTGGEECWVYIENTSSASITVNIRGNVYSTLTERSLSAGTSKWTIASGYTSSGKVSTTYFKIKPSNTGYISVDLKAYGDGKSYGKVTLYNIDKKKRSNTVNYESGLDGTAGNVYFGVTKGNTYYLKVTSVSDRDYYSYKYGVRYSMNPATDRSIGTKSSAKTLTRKADSTKTLFRATGSTSTDWYKFKVTAKRKTQVKIDTSRIKSGNVTVTFYKGTKKIGSSDTITTKYDGKTYTITYGPTSGKATSGTYYVKVVKSENASGLYRIRYVQ